MNGQNTPASKAEMVLNQNVKEQGMAHYTFDIIKYSLTTEEGETYKNFIEMMPSLTVQATNYIAATLKAEKAYPSDKYVHQLIDTDAEKWPVNATIF